MAARIDDPALAGDGRLGARAAARRAARRARACPNGASCRSRRSCSRQGVRDMVRISDARMSGTSYGACVLHVAPESYVGGPLALVRDGDMIELDVAARRLQLKVDDAELARRRAAWKRPAPHYERGFGALYQQHITQANQGCDFDFLEGTAPTPGSGDPLTMPALRHAEPSPRRSSSTSRRRDHAQAAGCARRRGGDDRAPPRRLQSRRPRFARRAARRQVSRMGARRHGCSPTRRRRSSSTATRSRSSTAIAASARSIGEFADAARHREGREKRHRDDRPAQLRASRARRRLGRDGGRGGPGVAALPQHVGRAARRAVRRQRPPAVDESDLDRRAASPTAIRSILDVTTSTVAEGKLMVALNKGEQVPEGWIIDRDGAPTTDPKDFYDGGALLTIGAHKGSGLSIVTDLLAGAVSTGTQLRSRRSGPAQQHAVDLHRARRVRCRDGGCAREARRFVDWVKASPPAKAGEPVLAPGDVERRTRAERHARRRAARRQDAGGSRRGRALRSASTTRKRARCSPDARERLPARSVDRATERMTDTELFPGFTHAADRDRRRDDPLRRRRQRPAAPAAARLSADARDVAPRRAARSRERYTVVCADLRGYGDSSKPRRRRRRTPRTRSARWRRTWSR